jgi:hypothetical protein
MGLPCKYNLGNIFIRVLGYTYCLRAVKRVFECEKAYCTELYIHF